MHCPLCFLNQRKKTVRYGEMPIEVAKAAVERYASERDALGRRILREVIPSTMGEPLLYSNFEELLLFFETQKIKLNLTTNGSFPGKWSLGSGMEKLLAACSDIKVSTLPYEMGGIRESQWRENVKRLMDCRKRMEMDRKEPLATVSLQVTLHGENVGECASATEFVQGMLGFAEKVGVQRIKWNPVVLLEGASREIRERYGVEESVLEMLRDELRKGKLRSTKVKSEGSLFFKKDTALCPVGGKCDSCPFEDEVWVWPDGHEDHCPNPERRWGAR